MSFCYFAFFRFPQSGNRAVTDTDIASLSSMLGKLASLQRGLIHTPVPPATAHPFPDDEPPPALGLQLYFPDIESIESHLQPDGALQQLRRPGAFPSLDAADLVQQQVMLTRKYPAPNPPTAPAASYLVHYPGQPEDLNAWLAYYHEHHPALMRTFPGIQEIELYTRVDWVGFVPGTRVDFFQRNKQVFASPQALSDGLMSPTMKNMRADYYQFPKFSGGNLHYPMSTQEVAIQPRI